MVLRIENIYMSENNIFSSPILLLTKFVLTAVKFFQLVVPNRSVSLSKG